MEHETQPNFLIAESYCQVAAQDGPRKVLRPLSKELPKLILNCICLVPAVKELICTGGKEMQAENHNLQMAVYTCGPGQGVLCTQTAGVPEPSLVLDSAGGSRIECRQLFGRRRGSGPVC